MIGKAIQAGLALEDLPGITLELWESPDLALGRFFLPGESLAELARAIERAKDSGLAVEVFVNEAKALFVEVWSKVMIPKPIPVRKAQERAMLSSAIGMAIDADVGLEQLLAAVEALWDRGSQSMGPPRGNRGSQSAVLLPLKIQEELAYGICRAKNSGGPRPFLLVKTLQREQKREQKNLFLAVSRRHFLKEVRTIWSEIVEAKKRPSLCDEVIRRLEEP